jgi:hypothetical protein
MGRGPEAEREAARQGATEEATPQWVADDEQRRIAASQPAEAPDFDFFTASQVCRRQIVVYDEPDECAPGRFSRLAVSQIHPC